MKRCIGYAGLLLLMMGWPMNVEAGPRTTTSVSGTRAHSIRGLLPDAVHARPLHEESRRAGPVKHDQVGGLPRLERLPAQAKEAGWVAGDGRDRLGERARSAAISVSGRSRAPGSSRRDKACPPPRSCPRDRRPSRRRSRRQAGQRAGVADQDDACQALGPDQDAEHRAVEVVAVGDERGAQVSRGPPGARSGSGAAAGSRRCRCPGACSAGPRPATAASRVAPSAAVWPRATTTPARRPSR